MNEAIALPVRDLMPHETATGLDMSPGGPFNFDVGNHPPREVVLAAHAAAGIGVGDVNSTAKGSGARYNTGKAPYELIPLRHIGQSYLTAGGLSPDEEGAAKALIFLGDYQSRRRGVGALYDALVALGLLEGWEECTRVFDYGRRKYAAWNWAKGMAWSIPIACAARHLEQGILQGEVNDRESKLAHRGHVFCNIVMLLAFADTYTEGDDRPEAGLLAVPRSASEPELS